jgi:hypothetical protein
MKAQDLHKYLVCDPVAGTLTWKSRPNNKRWNSRYSGKPALNSLNSGGYKAGKLLGKYMAQHRVIFAMCHGYWPDQVDHDNQIKTDNRLLNLFGVSHQKNQQNQAIASNNNSGVTGVHWYKSRDCWAAKIKINGRNKHLGYFDNLSDAASARKTAEMSFNYNSNHGKQKP